MKMFSDEHRRKLSESATKRWQDPEYRKEMAKIKISDDVKKMHSKNMKERWADPEYRTNHIGITSSEEKKIKISKKAKARWADPEFRARMDKVADSFRKPKPEPKLCGCGCGVFAEPGNTFLHGHNARVTHPMLGRKHSKETRKKLSDSHIGIPMTEENKRNISKANKLMWANLSEERKNTWIKNNRTSQRQSPTMPEKKMMSILDELYPGEWKFVGDGQVIIDGKCPDFINVNGSKKIIEVFGDYWHRGEDPQDRCDIFKPFGYKTLVVWESEFKDVNCVKHRLNGFMVE